MLRIARRGLLSAAASLPGMRSLLRMAALAPPATKTLGFRRAASAFASRCFSNTALIQTNLGISSSLRVLLPSTKGELVFGRPHDILAERATLALARALVPFSGAFIDVGANEGLFTFAVASDAPYAEIHCFEPDIGLFKRLTDNLSTNRIEARVNNIAAAGSIGERAFYRNLSDDSSGSLTKHFAEKHSVELTRVKSVLWLITLWRTI